MALGQESDLITVQDGKRVLTDHARKWNNVDSGGKEKRGGRGEDKKCDAQSCVDASAAA